jgi:uncharacterized protein YegP (UPF0339 family)
MPAKFEVYKDKKGEFRFRLKATNGETIATGEGYKAKIAVMKGIKSIQKVAPEAAIVDLTIEKAEEKKAAPKAAKAKTATKAKAASKPKATGRPRGRPKSE